MKTKSILNITVAGLALLAGGSASAQPGLATEEIQALTEAPDKVQRVACVDNLKQLGIAFQIWTANNGDLLPPDVLSMSNEVASTKALVCPADTGRQPANDWGSFTAANLSEGAQVSEAVPLLAAKLADPDESVRRAAADALGKMAAESKSAAPQLRAALMDTSEMVRTAAAAALIRVVPPANEAVPVLLEAITDNRNMNAHMAAWNVAREISPAAVPTVLQFLRGAPSAGSQPRDFQKWFRTRDAAIDLLGRMGPNAQAAVPFLIQALEDKRMPRWAVAESLGLIGPDAKAAVPSLKGALADQNPRVRLNAAVALARIDAQDESHVLSLIRFLKDQDSSIRATAASSLGEMGARARSAIPGLLQLASDDDDESVLREIARAVGAIESDTAKPVRE